MPAAATVAVVHPLLRVFQAAPGLALNHASSAAGHAALRVCLLSFVLGTVIAWGEALMPVPRPSALRRRVLGSITVLLAVGATIAGGLAVSHGHPFRFISRQWHGFSHQAGAHSGSSHFTDVGSGRYDFWRVALDAFLAHPVGGLGQDNFDNYYVQRRRTDEEPSYTHSLELRLLAHTGLVGAALFAVFLVAGIAAALRGRRRNRLAAAMAATALLPLVVWVIYGSVDWFWEFPALSGPALGFLGMAASLAARSPAVEGAPESDATVRADGALQSGVALPPEVALPSEVALQSGVALPPEVALQSEVAHKGGPSRPWFGRGAGALGVLALLGAVVVLGFPYLSVREESIGSNLGAGDPAGALHHLSISADLNPLSADPGRLAGTIALTDGRYAAARQRFGQSISRDPGGWYAWFGAGLAASALGDRAQARRDFQTAASINPMEPTIRRALSDLYGRHPLAPGEALRLLGSV
jgi:tetratricopeptide (TPR) repeat protein